MAWAYWSKKQGGSESLFFDTFSGGLGGFSFRKLVGSYTGRWGRAINITTLEERDIFYDSTGLVADVADILDLSNGTDTVELLNYDNSFLSIYFTPDSTRRPILANLGTLVTIGGLAAADFPAIRRISMSLSDNSTIDSTPLTVYSLAKIDVLTQRNLTVASASGNYGYFHGGTLAGYNGIGVYTFFDGVTPDVHSLGGEDFNRRLGTYHWTGATEIKMATNGDALTTFPTLFGAPAIRNIGVGQISTAQSFRGIIQEVLFFSTNKEASDTDIRTNINDYYSIW